MLAELMGSTFFLAPGACQQLEVLRRAVAGSDCFHLQVGILDEAVALIDALVSGVSAQQRSGPGRNNSEGPGSGRPTLP